ncbi:unnamed protein product [Ambrosiozyma monospora]|uniref:Unnamed protein product n=1 Tax=Ambrosiozyma monospora TaxID=43982 RepID=A0A9W6YWT4_AMBMO|nr:unnamed protein product [Ambrosiozyma monospora]
MSHGGFIPKYVRPPTGGWFHTPKNHNINGMLALTGYFAAIYFLYVKGEQNSFNPRTAYSLDTVKRWNAAAAPASKD